MEPLSGSPYRPSPSPQLPLPQQPPPAQPHQNAQHSSLSFAQRVQSSPSLRGQHSQQWEQWAPVITPPPNPPPTISPESSFNSSFSQAATVEDEYDPQPHPHPHQALPQFGGYTTVGLGISPHSPGHRRAVSQETISHESARLTDTPKTPYLSHDFLLGSPSHVTHRLQSEYSPYGPHPSSSALRRRRSWNVFHKGWTSSQWIMYALLVLGIVFAISHHIFYARLDGQPADDQLKMMRFGTLLAYVAKSSLVSAVIFAYRQQIWATVKRKNLKLRTIDNMFAGVDDVTAIMSWEFLKKARVAMALAMIVWLYPLTVILTPATLTVGPRTEVVVTQCNAVRTFDFEREKYKTWRKAERVDGYPLISLSLWNATVSDSGNIETPFNDTFFDYWTGTSSQTNLVSTFSVFVNKAVPRDNVSVETCGTGWNCSYVVSFIAPGYKCEQVAKGVDDNTARLKELGAPFDTTHLIPQGLYSYLAHTSLGDYSSVQIDAKPGGEPKNLSRPLPKHLGAFRTEPVLWIGHSDLADPQQPIPAVGDENWSRAFVPSISRCEHYMTNYTVQFNHTYTDQDIKVLSKTYLRPVINTTFVPGVDAQDGTMDNVTATPEENYVLPIDYENYRLVGAYHSLGTQLRNFINGTISYQPSIVANTEAMKTSLINKLNYLVVPDVTKRVQELYENMLLSLFSNPQFLVITWAANSTERAGRANATTANDPRLLYPCTKSRTINAYHFNVRDLWLVYAFAIVSAVAGVFFGAFAVHENNNHVRDIRVSSIMAATRASCLDELPWTGSPWGEVPNEIRERTMGYGKIERDGAAGPLDDPLQEKVMWGFAPVEVLRGAREGAVSATGSAAASTFGSPLKSPVSRVMERLKRGR